MKMLIIILVLISGQLWSQVDFSRQVISSGGSSWQTASGIGFQVTIGEAMTATLTGIEISFTQGFQQAPYAVELNLENPVNAFSPNGDGINDSWLIPAAAQSPENSVIIYNRWGDELKRIDNYNNISNYWEGIDKNGFQVPNGTYFYVINLKNLNYQLRGWVQITK